MGRLAPLLAILALLAVPAIAHASWAGPCPAPAGSPSYWVEACAAEHKEAEEAEKRAAEAAAAKAHAEANPPCGVLEWGFEPELCTTEAAEAVAAAAKAAAKAAQEAAKAQAQAAAEQAPVTFLQVRVRGHHGHFYTGPGYSEILISTTPYARITATGNHAIVGFVGGPTANEVVAKTLRFRLEGDALGERGGQETLLVWWSCRHPGETVRYTVTAVGGSGLPLVRAGHFKVPISGRWCATAKRREVAERRQVEAEETAQRQHEYEREVREVEHYEANCRAIGGIPVKISTRQGNRIVCHSKTGGVIPVPQ
jgi:hypothetical protein